MYWNNSHKSISKTNLYIYITSIFIFLSCLIIADVALSSLVTGQTPTEIYMTKLKNRSIIRDYHLRTLKKYDDYIVDLKKQQGLIKAQKQVFEVAGRHNLTVSKRAFDAAALRTYGQLQFVTNALLESQFIRNATELSLKKKVNNVEGIEHYIRTSTLQQQLSENILNGLNVKVEQKSFIKPLTASVERTFACTGEYFGLYVDPFIRGRVMSFGNVALGRSDTSSIALPIELQLEEGECVKQLACGSQHALLLTTRAVYGWGSNSNFQLDPQTEGTVDIPIKIVGHSDNINYIEAGYSTSLFITEDTGTVFVWGNGVEDIPTAISPSISFKKVCFGRFHAIGWSKAGQIYYWGSESPFGTIPSPESEPKLFNHPFFTENRDMIVDVQCGEYSTMILLNTGRVFSFGHNSFGVLGIGSSDHTPYPVPTSVSNIAGLRISKIRHKYYQVYGVTEDQQIVGWGNNANCQLGISTCKGRDADSASWSSAYNIPTLTVQPECEKVLDVLVMRDAALILCMANYTISLRAVGKLYVPLFPNAYPNTFRGEFTKIYQFPLLYLSPYEKRMAMYENDNIRILLAENQMLTISEYNTELVLVDKTLVPNSVVFQGFTNMFRAFSFYNTHDLYFNGSMWYFGGFVNNVPSDRIMSIPMNCPDCAIVYNQSLPYPVGAGSTAIVDDYLYIFGGISLDRGIPTPTTRVMRAKLEDLLTWTRDTELNLPFGLFDGASTLINENIYIFGGKSIPKSNQQILYASVVEKKWINSYQSFPYPFTGMQLVHDSTYFYLIGGMDYFLTPVNKIIRSRKTEPLYWEPLDQNLPPTINLGSFSALISNSSVHYLSIDLSLNPQTQLLFNVYSITFKSESHKTLINLENALIYWDGLRSCEQYLDEFGSLNSGLYWIKPVDSLPKFIIFCEQKFLGGGWQLVASRSKTTNPFFADIVYGDYDGASLNDQKWSAVRSKGIDIMTIDDTTERYAIMSLSSVSRIPCSPLTPSLTQVQLFHTEDDGCDSKGDDLCFFGFERANTGISKFCTNIAFKSWVLPPLYYEFEKVNIYVR